MLCSVSASLASQGKGQRSEVKVRNSTGGGGGGELGLAACKLDVNVKLDQVLVDRQNEPIVRVWKRSV